MDLWRSLGGMLTVKLTSGDAGMALNDVYREGVSLQDAVMDADGMSICFRIQRKDWKRIKLLSDRKGYQLTIRKEEGLYWLGKKILKRPVLMIGILFLLFWVFFLPTRVYFFQVEGNETIPTRLILEKCRECGISFGASREQVRSEKLKNALLEAIPQLQWAGINTSGCTATISVRERSVSEERIPSGAVGSIVAVRDGVITECTVTRGSAVCKPGDAVTTGQVLVSGYTDCGISIRATRAQAEVFARTERLTEVVTPILWQKKEEVTAQTTKYALIIGNFRINFYKGSGILDTTCDKMYSESYVTLPGGFQLPVILVKEQWTSYSQCAQQINQEAAEEMLSAFSRRYLLSQMVAGQILNSQITVSSDDELYRLQGKYACHEMIGQVKNEEIIAPYVKHD